MSRVYLTIMFTLAIAMPRVLLASGDIFAAGGLGVFHFSSDGQYLETLFPELSVALVQPGGSNTLFTMGQDGISRVDLLSGTVELVLPNVSGHNVSLRRRIENFAASNDNKLYVAMSASVEHDATHLYVFDGLTGDQNGALENAAYSFDVDRDSGELVVGLPVDPDAVIDRTSNEGVQFHTVAATVAAVAPGGQVFQREFVDENRQQLVSMDDSSLTYSLERVHLGYTFDEFGNLFYSSIANIQKVALNGTAIQFETPPNFLGTSDVQYIPFLNRYGDDTSPLSIRDVTMVTREVASGRVRDELDVDSSGNVTTEELISFLRSEQIVVGDANLDGIFNATDLVDVFQLSNFEAGEDLTLDWSMGDFNGDRQFSTRDLVMAFVAGGYDGNSPTVQSVPEPSVFSLFFPALIIVACLRDRRWPNARL
ncbi:MAG: hypothetical protein KDA87_06750 [Planctomycetales bacterium]|nr:hypothetical protein [Planctomycetales bacterium]